MNYPKIIIYNYNKLFDILNELSDELNLEFLHINKDKPNITLKKPNEFYYEIYKLAKEKAKEHKKAAISQYLEAKKIKNTYLLDDLDNSDESSMDDDEDSDSERIKDEINDIVEELT